MIGLLLFSCVNNEERRKFESAKELVSRFEPQINGYKHVFVISTYQCEGCVDSLMVLLNSKELRPILESSLWISPYEDLNYLPDLKTSQWLIVNQNVIEKFIPYAANITYIKQGSSGISECRELGIDMLEKDKLKNLLNR